jgi:hypothetical protein
MRFAGLKKNLKTHLQLQLEALRWRYQYVIQAVGSDDERKT